jgi:hypothetical protein
MHHAIFFSETAWFICVLIPVNHTVIAVSSFDAFVMGFPSFREQQFRLNTAMFLSSHDGD